MALPLAALAVPLLGAAARVAGPAIARGVAGAAGKGVAGAAGRGIAGRLGSMASGLGGGGNEPRGANFQQGAQPDVFSTNWRSF